MNLSFFLKKKKGNYLIFNPFSACLMKSDTRMGFPNWSQHGDPRVAVLIFQHNKEVFFPNSTAIKSQTQGRYVRLLPPVPINTNNKLFISDLSFSLISDPHRRRGPEKEREMTIAVDDQVEADHHVLLISQLFPGAYAHQPQGFLHTLSPLLLLTFRRLILPLYLAMQMGGS